MKLPSINSLRNGNRTIVKSNGKKFQFKKSTIIKIVAVIVVVALIVRHFFFAAPQMPNMNSDSDTTEIRTSTATTGNITSSVSGSGVLSNADAEKVTVPANVEIESVYVSSGDMVSKGDTIATVDTNSVMTALSDLQDEIDDLDDKLEDTEDDTPSSSVKAGVSGRVKKIYASSGKTVASVISKKGALMLLSLDGKMAVSIDTNDDLSLGDTVNVILSDSTKVTGTVAEIAGDSTVITVTDDGPEYNDKVEVQTKNGTSLGNGKLYIHSELAITGYTGTVSSVSVSENDEVSASTTLIKLKNLGHTAEYNSYLAQRQSLTEDLQTLALLYQDNTITAPFDGTIESITSDGDNATSSSSNAILAQTSASSGNNNTSLLSANISRDVSVDASNIVLLSATTGSDTTGDATTGSGTGTTDGSTAGSTTGSGTGTTDGSTTGSTTGSGTGTTDGSTTGSTTGSGTGTTDGSTTGSTTGSGTGTTDGSTTGSTTGSGTGTTGDNTNTNTNTTTDSSTTNNTTTGTATTDGTATANANANTNAASGTTNSTANANTNTTQNANTNANTNASSMSGLSGFSSSAATSGNTSNGALSSSALAGVTSGSSGTSSGSSSTTSYSSSTSSSSSSSDSEAVTVATISPKETMSVTISVDELDILSVELGQTVEVTVDAIDSDTPFTGYVTGIDTTGSYSGGVTKYSVDVTIDRTDSMLSNMNASCEIMISESENCLLISEDALQQNKNSTYVYTSYDESTGTLGGEVEVTTGNSDGTNVEITSGLSEGDTVYYEYSDASTEMSNMFGNMGNMGGGMPSGDFQPGNSDRNSDRNSGGNSGKMPSGMPQG